MFVVGKKYKFGNNIAECMYSGYTVVVLREASGKEYTPCPRNGLTYWKEYTPPKVHKWYQCVYNYDDIKTPRLSGTYFTEASLKEAYIYATILKVIEIEYTEES